VKALTFERKLIAKPGGLEKYRKMNEPMKVELITERADDIFSEYTLGPASIYISQELAARCERPDGAERMDQLFRAVISAPRSAIVKEEAKWKRERAKKNSHPAV
jgi:hypothetical protein